MRFEIDATGRTKANLWFSKKLATFLITGVALLVAVTSAASFWISDKHNALASDSADRMVRGGIASLEETMRTVTRDYSHWTEAYEDIRSRDLDWVYSNIGTGATDTGTADLIVIIEPGNAARYGWTSESGEAPESDLLPSDAIAAAQRLLEQMPVDEVVPVHFYAKATDTLWLLVASRMMPPEGLPADAVDADVPRLIMGLRIDDDLVAEIDAQFLIKDIEVNGVGDGARSSLPLPGPDGAPVGFVHWSPPLPGAHILGQIALPLGLTLVLLALAAALASIHLVRSARGLELAVEANRRKTEFLANASHELRTPMNGVIGIAQLLDRSGLDKQQEEMPKVLTTAAIEQMELIENLLDVSQIDSGMRSIAGMPFHPDRIVSEVLGVVAPEAQRKGLELRSDLADCETMLVLGDRDAFRRIVTNLVGNAVKFTQAGHVAVSLAASARQGRAYLTLRVDDSGPGIDPADHDRIFERFTRSDRPVTRKAGGTGLGLAITKSLVELMGGEIRLTSALGKRARFTVAMAFEIAEEAEEERDAA